jgi:arylsulfate sulfotransferase
MKSGSKSRWKSRLLIIVGIAAAVFIAFLLGMNALPAQDYSIYQINEQTAAFIQPLVENQKQVEQEIKAAYQSDSYTFDNPLVLQDPYSAAPLTALLMFETPSPVQVSVHIPGKTPQASVDFTFAGYSKHHEIPIYGLYPNTHNSVTLEAKDSSGKVSKTVIDLQTEPLPGYLFNFKTRRVDPDHYSPGMNFTFLDHKEVFDINGEIRWYSSESSFQTYLPLKNGHFLFTYNFRDDQNQLLLNNVLMERDLLGKIYAIYNVPNGAHHDYIELPNGNFLITSQDLSAFSRLDYLVEMDRKTGHIVRSFDLRNYLDKTRPHELDLPDDDWLHLNSIDYNASDQTLLISSRSQSAVVKMTYPEMKILWILGPHDNWPAKFQPYLLTPTGDHFDWQWAQHHATFFSEKTENGKKLVDILLFDNGNNRTFDPSAVPPMADSFSRMVRYEINETNRTVSQVWEYGKERGAEIFSASRGSAYLLANGDFLGTWSDIIKDKDGLPQLIAGYLSKNYSRVIEVNPVTKAVVFEVDMGEALTYRTFRSSFYAASDPGTSILSAGLMDTTVMDPGEQAVLALQPLQRQVAKDELWVKGATLKAIKWLKAGKISR